MPDPLSINVQHLKASETVAISNEAKRRKAAGEDVLDLGVGEPDFDTPAPGRAGGHSGHPERSDPLPAERRHRGAADRRSPSSCAGCRVAGRSIPIRSW